MEVQIANEGLASMKNILKKWFLMF